MSSEQEILKGEKRRTHDEPRNHLSVPSRSERDAIASRYCWLMASTSTCVPYGGSRELMPKSGAGGCGRTLSSGRALCWYGESRLSRDGEVGWLRT